MKYTDVLFVLPITACFVSGCASLKLSGPQEIFATCDRSFSHTVHLDNLSNQNLTGITCAASELSNVVVDNPRQTNISLPINDRESITFTGEVVNDCGSGYFEITCSGVSVNLGRYQSNTAWVDVDHTVLIGAGPPGVTPDNQGKFESAQGSHYTVRWHCCGGGGGAWQLQFDPGAPSENVDGEQLNGQASLSVRCPVRSGTAPTQATPSSVNITGKLTDKAQPGTVSVLAEGSRGDGECRLLTPVEAAGP